jgi:hypothetical protein
MSEPFKMREWVTIPEAAKHLSDVLNREFTNAKVLQLIFEGRLPPVVFSSNYLTAKKASYASPNADFEPYGYVEYEEIYYKNKKIKSILVISRDTIRLQAGLYDLDRDWITYVGTSLDCELNSSTFPGEGNFILRNEEGDYFFVCYGQKESNEYLINNVELINLVVRVTDLKCIQESLLKDNKPKVPVEQVVDQIIKEGREAGKSDPEIVAMIDAELTGKDRLTNLKIVSYFGNQNVSDEAKKKRGYRLRKEARSLGWTKLT